MKRRVRIVVLTLMGCVLVACRTGPPITTELIVGSYSYYSEESRATDHNLSRLVLQSGGRYDLVEGGTTKKVTEKKGVWSIYPEKEGQPPNVVLDDALYPIEITRNEIRLLIDEDTAIWWVKPR